ncbi:MAG: hypothetical protein EBR82_45225 [Caulobacteraceae bacterium]|nr:hypothetical protein [Caulobacteraceae bacterium]
MKPFRIIKCPHCDQPLPNSARDLIAGRVARAATVNVRHSDASRNEMATDIAAAEDAVDPSRACSDPRRPVEQGEEPERFDADWDGGVR